MAWQALAGGMLFGVYLSNWLAHSSLESQWYTRIEEDFVAQASGWHPWIKHARLKAGAAPTKSELFHGLSPPQEGLGSWPSTTWMEK